MIKDDDYREVETALANTLRVFLDSKQKLNSFEKACHESLTKVLWEVTQRRAALESSSNTRHEGR
jgi:hypothetical protein